MKNTKGTETETEVREKAKHLAAHFKRPVLGVCLPFGVEVVATALQKIEKTFVLGIMGEFRSGKSTLINALTGLPLALTDVVETTATLNEYRHGDAETAVIVMHDGSSVAMQLSELNKVLGLRRQDHEWLKTVDHVTVTVTGPSPFLEHLSIWDSPGLSGSVFNENLALQFLERLDVALWVFDLDFLGAQGLQTALDELGRRGTPVVALLNKAEGRSDAEIVRAKEYLTQAHDGIRFHSILPLSAARAVDGPEEGVDDAVGPDGGLDKLKRLLTDDVLAEPRLLLVQAAAEDLAVSANTFQHIYEEEASKRRRMLWLLKQQTDGIQSLGEQIVQEASVTVFHGLQQRVLDALSSAFEQEVEVASDQNLRDKKWIARAFDRVLTQERLQTIACDYMKEYEPDLVASWERAVVQAHQEFDSRLTPLDAVSIKESMVEDVPTMNWTWDPQEMPSAFAIIPDTSVKVLALSITKIASPRLAMAVAREFLSASRITLSTPKKPLEARKSRLINLAVTHFANVAREKLCPQVESHLVTPVLKYHKQQYCDTMVAVASKQIMGSVPERTVQDEETTLSKAGRKVAELTQEFHRLSNAPSRAIREAP
ncbi:dynamin family protein, partial [Armatimonas sp.]|uniref:dynamin family protein n=1 Tax=Armatimonas sp. TaxID=1872638 RepID=UPI0037532DEC